MNKNKTIVFIKGFLIQNLFFFIFLVCNSAFDEIFDGFKNHFTDGLKYAFGWILISFSLGFFPIIFNSFCLNWFANDKQNFKTKRFVKSFLLMTFCNCIYLLFWLKMGNITDIAILIFSTMFFYILYTLYLRYNTLNKNPDGSDMSRSR